MVLETKSTWREAYLQNLYCKITFSTENLQTTKTLVLKILGYTVYGKTTVWEVEISAATKLTVLCRKLCCS